MVLFFLQRKYDAYNFDSITAVYFPEESDVSKSYAEIHLNFVRNLGIYRFVIDLSSTDSLCRALNCEEGELCAVYGDDRAICLKEKMWKKMFVISKRLSFLL